MDNVELMRGIQHRNTTFNLQGGCNICVGNEKLKEDLCVLLTQEKGKFYPDPEFGSELIKYAFEPMTEVLASRIRNEVVDLVKKYYPQVNIKYIDVYYSENTLDLDIKYSYTDSTDYEEQMRLELFNQIGS